MRRLHELVVGGVCSWALFLATAGCASHIHDPANKTLADQAQKQLQTVVRAEQERLGLMTANLEKMYAQETQAHRELTEGAVKAVSRQVLEEKWTKIRSDFGTAANPGPLAKRVTTAYDRLLRSLNADLALAKAANDGATERRNKAEAALTAAQERLSRWNRRIAALEKLIQITPATTALGDVQGFESFKATARSLAERAAAEKVTYLDAAGAEQTSTLKDEIVDLFDDSHALRNGDRETGSILAGLKDILKDQQAPGLVVTVAALAKDLAETERARTLARIAAIERRMEIVRTLEQTKELSDTLVAEGVNVEVVADFPDRDEVKKTLAALATQVRAANDASAAAQAKLDKAMQTIQAYVALAGVLAGRVRDAEREDAYLRHVQSIQDSAISITQHQALVSRGLEGLSAYHGGGMKPEQVADLVHKAVQLLLLGVIAGGQ